MPYDAGAQGHVQIVRVYMRAEQMHLEDEAAVVLLATLGARQEGGTSSVLEDFTDTLAGLGGALEVVLGADLLRYRHTLYARKTK